MLERRVDEHGIVCQHRRWDSERHAMVPCGGSGKPSLPQYANDYLDISRPPQRRTKEERQALMTAARQMRAAGLSFRRIGVELGVSRETIATWIGQRSAA
jgi:hypothetical protein